MERPDVREKKLREKWRKAKKENKKKLTSGKAEGKTRKIWRNKIMWGKNMRKEWREAEEKILKKVKQKSQKEIEE